MDTKNSGRMTYYDHIKELSPLELDRGLKRLGRVLAKSCEVQRLTGREIHALTTAIYTVGVNATHIGDIKRGMRTLREDTIHRLVYICLEVEYFEFVSDDKIGIPHFKYKGAIYNDAKHRRLELMGFWKPNGTNESDRPKLEDLPDIEFRYKSIKPLIDIIRGGDHIKSKYTLQKKTLIQIDRDKHPNSIIWI